MDDFIFAREASLLLGENLQIGDFFFSVEADHPSEGRWLVENFLKDVLAILQQADRVSIIFVFLKIGVAALRKFVKIALQLVAF